MYYIILLLFRWLRAYLSTLKFNVVITSVVDSRKIIDMMSLDMCEFLNIPHDRLRRHLISCRGCGCGVSQYDNNNEFCFRTYRGNDREGKGCCTTTRYLSLCLVPFDRIAVQCLQLYDCAHDSSVVAQGLSIRLSTKRTRVIILSCYVKHWASFFHSTLLQFIQLYE